MGASSRGKRKFPLRPGVSIDRGKPPQASIGSTRELPGLSDEVKGVCGEVKGLSDEVKGLSDELQNLNREPGGHRDDLQTHKEDSNPTISPDHAFAGDAFADFFGPFG